MVSYTRPGVIVPPRLGGGRPPSTVLRLTVSRSSVPSPRSLLLFQLFSFHNFSVFCPVLSLSPARVIGDFIECRDALGMRLIFQRRGDTLEFHFYGTHDEVKAFLRNRR